MLILSNYLLIIGVVELIVLDFFILNDVIELVLKVKNLDVVVFCFKVLFNFLFFDFMNFEVIEI